MLRFAFSCALPSATRARCANNFGACGVYRRHWRSALGSAAQSPRHRNTNLGDCRGQGGQHTAKRETWGHSMVIDPWGSVVAQLSQQGDLLVAEIDLAYSEKIRQNMPVAQHGRFTHLLNKKAEPSL
nr:nitrilase-related carbon-nitrogen hydrolase [Vibrio navarrensis]